MSSPNPSQPTTSSVYLQAHYDSFRVEQQVAFRKVFLKLENHGKNLARNCWRS